MFYFNSAGLLGLTRIHWRSDIVRTGYYLSVVVLMGDRVRLGLVGGKTVPPPCGVSASRGLFSPPTEYQGSLAFIDSLAF